MQCCLLADCFQFTEASLGTCLVFVGHRDSVIPGASHLTRAGRWQQSLAIPRAGCIVMNTRTFLHGLYSP